MFNEFFTRRVEMNQGIARHVGPGRHVVALAIGVCIILAFGLVDPFVFRRHLSGAVRAAILVAALLAWFFSVLVWVYLPALRSWEAEVNHGNDSADESDED